MKLFSAQSRRLRIPGMFLALCLGLALGESWLPPATAQTRSELPGCVMLAALPRRRLAGIEEVCPGTITPAGFTLIELSVVLVIIGLLAGAVLAGQDLIHAAEARAQITQIEKYNSATNTFREKFGGIPGDLQLNLAYQFGFNTYECTGGIGGRNGNGLIEGYFGETWLGGESNAFWEDLSSAGLIAGQYPNSGASVGYSGCNILSGLNLTPGTAYIGDVMPAGKIGYGTFLYVYEYTGANWFGLTEVTAVISGHPTGGAGIPVIQAYRIDSKIDDGLPQSGNVKAVYLNANPNFPANAPNNATAGGDSTTCYDTTTGTYSVTVNSGSGSNCGLSFRMQGAGP